MEFQRRRNLVAGELAQEALNGIISAFVNRISYALTQFK
jgi:hypothetical protein